MRKYIIAIFIVFVFSGCIKEQDISDNFKQRLVVEGRIENGRAAIVALSLNIGTQNKYSSENLSDMIVRWAKVTVVDDEGNEEILTGRSNRDYPTRYIYTGSEIIGEVGHSYKLIVEYSEQRWEALTTISVPTTLEDIKIEHYQDSLYTITAIIPPLSTPCSIDCSLNGSTYYAPTILGVYNASTVYRHISINCPLLNLERNDYVTYFKSNDAVRLRINALDNFSYYYWSEWENSMINSVNPVFPTTSNMPSNISNNGIGIWAGYGTVYYDIGVIPNP
jgi:hypothetical protein